MNMYILLLQKSMLSAFKSKRGTTWFSRKKCKFWHI